MATNSRRDKLWNGHTVKYSAAVVLNSGQFGPPEGIWQCLETVLVVTIKWAGG